VKKRTSVENCYEKPFFMKKLFETKLHQVIENVKSVDIRIPSLILIVFFIFILSLVMMYKVIIVNIV